MKIEILAGVFHLLRGYLKKVLGKESDWKKNLMKISIMIFKFSKYKKFIFALEAKIRCRRSYISHMQRND